MVSQWTVKRRAREAARELVLRRVWSRRTLGAQDTEGGFVEISAVDPVASMAAVHNPALAPLAERVRAKLRSVIDSL